VKCSRHIIIAALIYLISTNDPCLGTTFVQQPLELWVKQTPIIIVGSIDELSGRSEAGKSGPPIPGIHYYWNSGLTVDEVLKGRAKGRRVRLLFQEVYHENGKSYIPKTKAIWFLQYDKSNDRFTTGGLNAYIPVEREQKVRKLINGEGQRKLESVALGGLLLLTHQDVVRIADAFARKEGICLTCYKRPVIRYNKAKAGNYWSAYYAPMPDRHDLIAVGSDFSVRIDEASRTASDDPLR
jgi:hypothetical protein